MMSNRNNLLLDTVSFSIGIYTLDVEILAVFADRDFATAFCLPMTTWFASMVHSVLVSCLQ